MSRKRLTSPAVADSPPDPVVERRDVTRNRAKLLAAADEVIAARGEDATIEAIARRAGLGVGTAYRHFANKRALLEALFATRIDRILELANQISRTHGADALEPFIREASALLAGDRGLRDAVSVSDGFEVLRDRREQLAEAVTALVDRARASGTVRPDFEPTDVPVIFKLVGTVADAEVDRDLWRRYLEILLDGIRPPGMARLPLPVDAPTPREVAAVVHPSPRAHQTASEIRER